MAKSSNMKDLLKQRMSAAQQVSEMEIGNRAYESLIDPLLVAASTIRELPVDKLRPFFTTDIGFHPYPPEKREDWLSRRLSAGTQVVITNPKCVETGLDLNAFTTLIFYSMGYNLFTLRQASRRSWRINQTAPRVEVYMLYYADTMQAKAMKLMASKLAVAGLIEGTFSEEGLVAMSDVQDMTSQMAKELMLGIKDNVEDNGHLQEDGHYQPAPRSKAASGVGRCSGRKGGRSTAARKCPCRRYRSAAGTL